MAATPSEPPASRPAPPDVVVPLTRADLPAAAAVLAAALADDPGFRHLFPVDSRRERELRALYRMTLSDALAHGHTYVTKLDGVVTGAVALYAPGTYPHDDAPLVATVPADRRDRPADPHALVRSDQVR